jgi:hypothetical protein
MAITDLPRRIFSAATGDLTNPEQVVHVLEDLRPGTGEGPNLAILDLSGKLFSPASLRHLVVPLGQQVLGGVFGQMKVVIVSSDPAVLEQVALLAREHKLPLFLAASRDPSAIEQAIPAGNLTPSEVETLNYIRDLGGITTVARLAEAMNLESNAATNRLVNVDRKGYLYRIKRNRQIGDLFVDPRTRRQAVIAVDLEREPGVIAKTPGSEVESDSGQLTLEGSAAELAQEIIRRNKH